MPSLTIHPSLIWSATCPNCDEVYNFHGGDREAVRKQFRCGRCDSPLAIPPSLRLLPGGRINA